MFKPPESACAVHTSRIQVRNNCEYGSTIYKTIDENGDVKYSYTVPNKGKTGGGVVPSQPRDRLEPVAIVHTHGAYNSKDVDRNQFSMADTYVAFLESIPIYVATPNGSLLWQDKLGSKSRVVSTDMPSDPNDISRKNNVSPFTNLKEDPIRTIWDEIVDAIYNIFN